MNRLTGADHKARGFYTYIGEKNPYHVPMVLGELASVANPDYSAKEILKEVFGRLAAYEDTGLEPEEIVKLNTFAGSELERMLEKLQAMTAERDELQKAFALACRILADEMCCPAAAGVAGFAGFPECENEDNPCEGHKSWECWQRHIRERVESEQVCRVCGCTQENACPGGCWWVEEDLCSSCAEPEEAEEGGNG